MCKSSFSKWDIFGVHDTDGQILAVKKGESLPVTTKYKRKHTSSTPVKFHVNTKLQVETIPYEPKKKKTLSPQASLTASYKCDGVRRLTGEKSPQSSLPCDEGHRGAGNSGGGRSGMSGILY